ncbi:hypothetical protein K439DRAFT_1622935 [Ramaria rubella]|nr:hypothetical protein K439DRAFT_1622935 [Ramaria rubella]
MHFSLFALLTSLVGVTLASPMSLHQPRSSCNVVSCVVAVGPAAFSCGTALIQLGLDPLSDAGCVASGLSSASGIVPHCMYRMHTIKLSITGAARDAKNAVDDVSRDWETVLGDSSAHREPQIYSINNILGIVESVRVPVSLLWLICGVHPGKIITVRSGRAAPRPRSVLLAMTLSLQCNPEIFQTPLSLTTACIDRLHCHCIVEDDSIYTTIPAICLDSAAHEPGLHLPHCGKIAHGYL